MIVYCKSRIRIAEMHFNEKGAPPPVDVVRYRFRTEPMEGGRSAELHTILIDLTQDQDQLLAGMNDNTRHQIRKGGRSELTVEFSEKPDLARTEEFFAFWREFALLKGMPDVNRDRLLGMREHGALALSRVRDQGGETLVWHCYVYTKEWTRLVYSASLFRKEADKARTTLTGIANRYLHWQDMLRFREMGLTTYDMGGWYAGQTNGAKLKINYFKEGFGGAVVPVFTTDLGITLKGSLAIRLRDLKIRWQGGE